MSCLFSFSLVLFEVRKYVLKHAKSLVEENIVLPHFYWSELGR